MSALQERASERLATAHRILDELDLLDRWRPYGSPLLVGSVGLGLVVAPDIDVEIYSTTAGITESFVVASALAEIPGLFGMRYRDFRNSRENGIYWRADYALATGEVWKLDLWLFNGDVAPVEARLAAIRRALTDEHRDTILAIKEEAQAADTRAHGHWLYRAVLNEGVRTLAEYRAWMGDQDVWERVSWEPRS